MSGPDGPRYCASLTQKGEPCRVVPRAGEAHCVWHHPGRQGEATRMRRRGGYTSKARNRGKALPPEDLPPDATTPEECEDSIRWTLRAVKTGDLDERRARVAIDGYKALHAAMLKRENYEARMRDLERIASGRAKREAPPLKVTVSK